MVKTQEKQEWFLIKWNWESWLLTLSDEDAGKIVKALYTGVMPEGILGTLLNSHFDEFKRVNNFRAEKQKERSETNSKNAKSRWDKSRELESERKSRYATAYDRIDNNTTVCDRIDNDATAYDRNANTEYILHNTENIIHNTEDIVYSTEDNSIERIDNNSIVDKFDLIMNE